MDLSSCIKIQYYYVSKIQKLQQLKTDQVPCTIYEFIRYNNHFFLLKWSMLNLRFCLLRAEARGGAGVTFSPALKALGY